MTVEQLFPTASISQPAIGMLSRYIDLFLSFMPLIIGIAVIFSIVFFLIYTARMAVLGIPTKGSGGFKNFHKYGKHYYAYERDSWGNVRKYRFNGRDRKWYYTGEKMR